MVMTFIDWVLLVLGIINLGMLVGILFKINRTEEKCDFLYGIVAQGTIGEHPSND